MKMIDIHTHGGCGVNFNTACADDIKYFAREIKKRGIVAFCPTLASDTIENMNIQLGEIKAAMGNQEDDEAKILGVHIEGPFLNPRKKGIHRAELLLTPSVENFEKLKHREIIKIVSMALELDDGLKLRDYLQEKGIRVQLAHSEAKELYGADAVTHHFNAMPLLHHREPTMTLKALIDDNIYCEIIADTKHVSSDMLKLFFKVKNHSKIILVSDSLAITHSKLQKMEFCNSTIKADGTGEGGTLGGGVMFLDEIVENLDRLQILNKKESAEMVWDNVLDYLKVERVKL